MNDGLALLVSMVFASVLSQAVFAGGASAAPMRPVTDDYFGVKIADPYRYFENLADPEVQAWFKLQAQYAQQALHALPDRDKVLQRIRELDSGAPFRLHPARRWPNGDLHYYKMLASENLEKFYFRDARTGEEKLLIDPEKFAGGGKHYSLSFCQPSPDRKYIAYGVAAAGSEQTEMHILDVASGKDLPDVIDRMESDYTAPHWLPDSKTLVYSRRRLLPPKTDPTEIYKKSRSYLHQLGTDPARDPVIFAMESRGVAMDEADFPSVMIAPGSRWAIGKIHHGDAQEKTLYAAPVESLGSGEVLWKKICGREQEVKDFAVAGDAIYLLSAAGAPRYKMVRLSLREPDFSKGEVLWPPGEAVLQRVEAARDGLYLEFLRDGISNVARIAYRPSAKSEPIELPANEPSGHIMTASPDTDGAMIGTTSWTRAGRLYQYDPAKSALVDTGLVPRGKYDDPQGVESLEVKVTSHDGVKVPLSIIFKNGTKLDASHPTILGGYGAYGMSSSPRFSPVNLAWLERGGIIAVAHVRGGGEYGKEWHHAGQKATKPNTWKDFIACAQYLIDRKYTSREKLAGMGGSAGGILIGRAITDRPDLFAAALVKVGCLDALRMETTANGVPNIQEFGTVKTREGFDALLAMSTLHHIRDGVKYPAILFTHGINDPRVEPWQSAKAVARFQAATASAKPVLFRVDYQAGHGIGSTKKQRQEQSADEWAFLLWQMGTPEFQKQEHRAK